MVLFDNSLKACENKRSANARELLVAKYPHYPSASFSFRGLVSKLKHQQAHAVMPPAYVALSVQN